MPHNFPYAAFALLFVLAALPFFVYFLPQPGGTYSNEERAALTRLIEKSILTLETE